MSTPPPKKANSTVEADPSPDTVATTQLEATESPAKKQKSVKYYCFEMNPPLKTAYIEGELAAQAFENDYSEMIQTKLEFSCQTKWKAHEAKAAKTQEKVELQKKKEEDTAISNSLQANKIIDFITENVESDKLIGFWKTTSTSKIAVIIIHAENRYKQTPWFWKPTILADVIKGYGNTVTMTNLTVAEAFQNMRHAAASDPKLSDKTIQLHDTWKTRDNVQKATPVNVMYTYVNIPTQDISTQQDEITWLTSTTIKIVNELAVIMKTDTFEQAMMVYNERMQSNFIATMYDPKKGTNLPKFLKSVKAFKQKQVEKLTDHVTQSESNEIMGILFTNRVDTPKYQP